MRVSAIVLGLVVGGTAQAAERTPRPDLAERIEAHAQRHGVPVTLLRRVIRRESNFNPGLIHRGNFGLMQIKYATARGMGYAGAPRGLLDPDVNLTYATPYLANAYRLSGGSEDRAVSLYSSGFYYVAKRQGVLASLRTASSPSLAAQKSESLPPEPPATDPVTSILRAIFD